MNSWLLPLWQNESLCKTIRMKMQVTCTFILLKIKSFSCEMFCTSIRSKRDKQQLRSGSKVCIWAHQIGAYPGFCSMKWLGVFLLPPGWDTSPSRGYPAIFNLPVLIYTLEWKEALWELSVLLKNTIQCSQPGLEARLIEIEKKYKNQITGC